MFFRRCFQLAIIAATFTPGVWGAKKKTKKAQLPPKIKTKYNSCSIGLAQVESTRSFEDTYNAVLQVLKSNSVVYIATEFDAVKVASVVGVTGLPPNRVIVFGNPVLDTPLIVADQAAALDLPHKIHVYQTIEGKVMVGYNVPKYLEKRFKALGKAAEEDLQLVATGLKTVASDAAGVDPETIDEHVFKGVGKDMFSSKYRAGVYKRESAADFKTTLMRLVQLVEQKKMLLVGTVDQQAAAASQGFEIRPTTLIMLCFPAFDATFMQSNQCAVADFPLKILLLEDELGVVQVRMNNFNFLRERHHVYIGSVNEEVYNFVQNTVLEIIEGATE